jgi:hypothetical protein
MPADVIALDVPDGELELLRQGVRDAAAAVAEARTEVEELKAKYLTQERPQLTLIRGLDA